jgi:hypothetical protein
MNPKKSTLTHCHKAKDKGKTTHTGEQLYPKDFSSETTKCRRGGTSAKRSWALMVHTCNPAWEDEIRKIKGRGQPGQIIHENPISKTTRAK